MKITKDTTVGELMDLLKEVRSIAELRIDDPIVSFDLCHDGSFCIQETYYNIYLDYSVSIKDDLDITATEIADKLFPETVDKCEDKI